MNGFSIHIGDCSSPFGRPVAVPGGMHAQIDISEPLFHKDRSRCVTLEAVPKLVANVYDARGWDCMGKRLINEVIQPYLGCMFPWQAANPNGTTACTGVYVLPLKMIVNNGLPHDKETERKYVSYPRRHS